MPMSNSWRSFSPGFALEGERKKSADKECRVEKKIHEVAYRRKREASAKNFEARPQEVACRDAELGQRPARATRQRRASPRRVPATPPRGTMLPRSSQAGGEGRSGACAVLVPQEEYGDIGNHNWPGGGDGQFQGVEGKKRMFKATIVAAPSRSGITESYLLFITGLWGSPRRAS
jgi:hypothetical protein